MKKRLGTESAPWPTDVLHLVNVRLDMGFNSRLGEGGGDGYEQPMADLDINQLIKLASGGGNSGWLMQLRTSSSPSASENGGVWGTSAGRRARWYQGFGASSVGSR